MRQQITGELFVDFINGDQAAFKQVIRLESKNLQQNILRFIKTELDAEEILQDIFMETWNNRSSLKTVDDLYGYMRSRVRYMSLNFLNRRVESTDYYDDDDYLQWLIDKSPADALSQYEVDELQLRVSVAINKMPEQRRRVFQMRRFDDMKRAEIATELNISPNTVTRHLNMAMTELKKMLLFIVIAVGQIYKL